MLAWGPASWAADEADSLASGCTYSVSLLSALSLRPMSESIFRRSHVGSGAGCRPVDLIRRHLHRSGGLPGHLWSRVAMGSALPALLVAAVSGGRPAFGPAYLPPGRDQHIAQSRFAPRVTLARLALKPLGSAVGPGGFVAGVRGKFIVPPSKVADRDRLLR